MPKFGSRSLNNLASVHPVLVEIATAAVSRIDFTVICGHRDKAGQDEAVRNRTTKVSFPNSAHNQMPSVAIDVIPYPFTNWNDPAMFEQWKAIADIMMDEANKRGVQLRWGGDFNRDGNKTTNDSWDKPHFELHPWRAYAK